MTCNRPLGTVKIDNACYEPAGKDVTFTSGHGDDAEEFTFTTLKLQGSQGRVYLHEEKGRHYLYALYEGEAEVGGVEDTVTLSGCKGSNEFNPAVGKKLRWGWLKHPLAGLQGPFESATDFLSLGEPGSKDYRLFANVPLTREGEHYYSPRFPASALEPAELEVHSGQAPAKFLNYGIALSMLVVLVVGALTSDPRYLKVFWWLGPCALAAYVGLERTHLLHRATHILAAAFGFHFVTHGLDNWWVIHVSEATAVSFESGRAALLLFLLLFLRMSATRGYFILGDGAADGGLCSCVVFVVGGLALAFFTEIWYFSWFSWYVGQLPGALLWPVIFVVMLGNKRDDYAKVALHLDGFGRALGRTMGLLRSGSRRCIDQSKDVVLLLDDLADSVKLSEDPGIRRLFALEKELRAASKAAKALEKLDPEEMRDDEMEHLDHDLETLAEDLQRVAEHLDPEPPDELSGLRISPYLRTRP